MHLDRFDRMTLDSSDSVGISRFYRGFTLSSNDRKKDFEKISGSKICFETSSNIEQSSYSAMLHIPESLGPPNWASFNSGIHPIQFRNSSHSIPTNAIKLLAIPANSVLPWSINVRARLNMEINMQFHLTIPESYEYAMTRNSWSFRANPSLLDVLTFM
jgi:hypothetical protein